MEEVRKIPGDRLALAGLAALFLIAALCGCGQDDDSSILFDRNPRTDTGTGPFTAEVTAVAADTTILAPIATSSSPALLAGRIQDGSGVLAARPYFRFTSLPDSADVDTLFSAVVTVTVRDRYGEETATLSLYPATAVWKADSLDYESTPHDPVNKAGDFAPAVGAVGDTTRLRLRADALVASWIAEPDSNFGVFIDTDATDALVRLYSAESNPGVRTPSLTIIYRQPGASALDTTVVVASADAYALAHPDHVPDEARLEIAGGWALRALVRFETDSLRAAIPDEATVVRARLILPVVDQRLRLGSVPVAAYAVTSEWSEASAEEVAAATTAAATATYDGGPIVLEIPSLVRDWMVGRTANRGALVRLTVEPSDLARLSVGARENPVESSRPRLELTYTLPPGARP